MFKDIEFKKIDWNNIHSCVTPSICYAEAMIEDMVLRQEKGLIK